MDSEAKVRQLKREIASCLSSLIDPLLSDEELKILNDKVNVLMGEKRILEGGSSGRGGEKCKYLYFGRAAELEEILEVKKPFREVSNEKPVTELPSSYYGDDVGDDFLKMEEEYETRLQEKTILPDFITKLTTKLPPTSYESRKPSLLKIPTNQEMEVMVVEAHKKRLTALIQERYGGDR